MTKKDIVSDIIKKTNRNPNEVSIIVESLMKEIISSVESGNNVYLRGFGGFIVKERAEKIGRNISKNTTITVPACKIPSFKPSQIFTQNVSKNNPVR